MKPHQYLAIFLLLISLGLIGLGQVISHPEIVGGCINAGPNCITQDQLFGIGHPLLLSIYLLPILFFALIFVKGKIFWRWAIFIIPFALFGFSLIYDSYPLAGSIGQFDRTSMTFFVVKWLVILSALFIGSNYLWDFYKNRKLSNPRSAK